MAQSFEISHTSITFTDSERDRSIPTEIYYPADTPGEEVPLAEGSFPVLVFGHGFVMSWEAYENIWEDLVHHGYVLCFPTTEMGLAPSHSDFGMDLAFIADQMQLEATLSASHFFNALADETALMGHSMGGGASFLAAQDNPSIQALVNFAAAETNPSAIAAASSVSVPALLFSGEDDCVTPAEDHQDLMYNSLSSPCKTQVDIINGGHCYFADESLTCSFGESFCNPDLMIDREEQQAVTRDFLKPWLDYTLKGDDSAFVTFNDSLQTSVRINFSQSCPISSLEDAGRPSVLTVFPNPATDKVMLTLTEPGTGGVLSICDLMGHIVYEALIRGTSTLIDLSSMSKGSYILSYTKAGYSWSQKLVVF